MQKENIFYCFITSKLQIQTNPSKLQTQSQSFNLHTPYKYNMQNNGIL